ncbi:chemotaxis protein CheX [Actinomycetaceae bacterium L2_0104]
MTDETAMTEQVLAIAEDVFTAMIDGEEGGIRLWEGPLPAVVDPLHAWVDVNGALPARAAVTAERGTCLLLARALMSMELDEEVSKDDLVDAFGEVANVVGGNIKALIPDPGALSLPRVAESLPTEDAPEHRVELSWRASPIFISLWTLDNNGGDKA